MEDKSVAILGLGRSGLAIGRACIALGAHPVVFDEKPEDELVKRDVLEEAHALDIPVVLGYRPDPHWFSPFPTPPAAAPDLVVTNPAVPKWHPGLLDARDRGIEVISEIEFAYRIARAPIVAITGTNGKSTTTVMTYLALRACGVDAVLCGNIFGSGYPERPLTEAALESSPEQVLVAEVSSFQLEWVRLFRPVAAAITNITPDHLDRYDSFEEYAETKRRIWAAQRPEDWRVAAEADGRRVRMWNHRERIDAEVLDDRLILANAEVRRTELPFHEPHNATNACMASLLALGALRSTGRADSLPPQVVESLKAFRGLAHRMERLGQKNGVAVINNSMCTNPAAVASSASSVPGRTHLLIGGVNKALDFEPLRRYLAQSGDVPYLFGSDAEELRKMLRVSGPTYRTMEEAFEASKDGAKSGETIMLAPGCASTDQFRDFRHRGDVFKAIAMEWLSS